MLQKKKVIPSTRMTTSSRCNKVTEGLITIFMSGVQYRMGAVKSVHARELRGHSVRSRHTIDAEMLQRIPQQRKNLHVYRPGCAYNFVALHIEWKK